MNIYKLRFNNREEGIQFFEQNKLASIENDNFIYNEGVVAIVEIGKIVDSPAEFNGEEIIKEATYLEGYHFDIMCEQEIISEHIVNPKNSNHSFYGTETTNIIEDETEII